MSEWAMLCAAQDRVAVLRAMAQIDASAHLHAFEEDDELRFFVLDADPGDYGVVIAQVAGGVEDVNLAAAVANDGNARSVVLMRHGVSGSLRSRAARAGIDLVVDLDEVGEGPAEGPGGRSGRGRTPDAGRGTDPSLDSDPDFDPDPDPEPPGGGSPASARASVLEVVDSDAVPLEAYRIDLVDGEDVPEQAPAAAAGAVDSAAKTGPGYAAPYGRRSKPLPEGCAPVVAFCSGRGGAGKTALVAMAAAAAASWGMRVCAVDLDLSCGNLFSAFGMTHGTDLAALADLGGVTRQLVEQLMAASSVGVRVAGPCERPEAAELAMPHVGGFLQQAAALCDLVLVDTSTTFTDAVAQAAQMSDRLVLVSEAGVAGLAPLARMSGLAVRLGVARTRIVRLENRANPRDRADLSFARAEVGLEAARAFRVFDGGPEVRECLSAGLVGELVDSGSVFADSVASVMAQLLGELGRLPNNKAAQEAAKASTTRRWPLLFARKAAR